jgi:aspartyl-tRNA(Asn)/glutamyl-tRNA(Gln) amidotransferase subunit C
MSTKHTDSPLTTETVEHVADLARITLSKEEVGDAIHDLSSILGHINLIRSIDTSGVEPLDHPTELLDRNREDEVSEPLSQQQVLSNAPAVRDVYLDVPKVLGGNN